MQYKTLYLAYLFHNFLEGLEVEVLVEGAHLLHQRRRVQRGPREHHAALITAQPE